MQLTNAAAIAVGRRCPRLQALCLSGCRKVGSAGVRALAARGATLTELDLTRLSLASEEAVAAVVGASTNPSPTPSPNPNPNPSPSSPLALALP